MKYLTREEILAADDLQVEEVAVPEWGGTVRLRVPDAYTWQQINERMREADTVDVRLIALAGMLVDENDQPLFELGEIQELARKNFQVIRRLSDRAFQLSRSSQAQVEALAQNFETPQDGNSPSA